MIQGQNTAALLHDLTSNYVKNTFNPNTPNQKGILYQAYGGKINPVNFTTILDPTADVGYILYALMKAGDNDGLVSLKSAHIPASNGVTPTWKGNMTTSVLYPGVSHFAEIDHFLDIHTG